MILVIAFVQDALIDDDKLNQLKQWMNSNRLCTIPELNCHWGSLVTLIGNLFADLHGNENAKLIKKPDILSHQTSLGSTEKNTDIGQCIVDKYEELKQVTVSDRPIGIE